VRLVEHTRRWTACLAVGVSLLAAAPADAAPKRPDLQVSVVGRPPSTAFPGEAAAIRVSVANRGPKGATRAVEL
jgi:hypothetical protein